MQQASGFGGLLFCFLSFSTGAPCADLFPFFAPDVYPAAFAAGDGVARYADDLADIRDAHRLERLALGIADVVEGVALRHEEIRAPSHDLSQAAACEPANLLALVVVDVIPVFGLLDVRYLLSLCLRSHCRRQQQDGEQLFHGLCIIAKIPFTDAKIALLSELSKNDYQKMIKFFWTENARSSRLKPV